jgi:hypothetical protein
LKYLLLPYIHVHQFLGNLSSVITVRKLLCWLFMRRISYVVIDYEYIFLKIRNMLTYMSVLQKLLDEACRTECLATPFARLDTPWFTLVGLYKGVGVWEGITDTDVLLWDTLNSVAVIQNIHQSMSEVNHKVTKWACLFIASAVDHFI